MITIEQISGKIKAVKIVKQNNFNIKRVIQLDKNNTDFETIFWCNDKNLPITTELKGGTLICSEKALEGKLNPNCNYIIAKNPRSFFRELIVNFFYTQATPRCVSKLASIDASAKIGINVSIGNYVTIEANCIIGDNTCIGHNTVLLSGSIIGNNVFIGSNNTIGGNGFGYEKDDNSQYQLMPHIGNVVIEDYVEIGNNTCIDRGVLGSTLIKKNAKIDNLVHIAHGVIVGENSLVIANAMIGGSTIIGDNVWIAPSASLINKIDIGDNSLVGMGAVVVKSVPKKTTVLGNPAKPKQ